MSLESLVKKGVSRSRIADITLREIRELVREVVSMAASSAQGGQQTSAPLALEQKRVVAVIDRGWIFAGDQSMTSDGYIRLDNAVHVFGWKEIGFTKMLTEWKSSKVDVRSCDPPEFPPDAVLFRVPVESGWGLK